MASDEKDLIEVSRVHAWLGPRGLWATGRSLEVVARSIEHSLVLGLYADDGAQVGFAGVVSDRCSFGWLCDVFVSSSHEGKGLGSFLVERAIVHPELAGVRFVLAAVPSRSLYRRQEFVPLPAPERWMEPRPR